MDHERRPRLKSSFMLVTYGILLYLGLTHFSTIKSAFVWLFAIIRPVAYGICIAFVINLILNLFKHKVFRNMSASSHPIERKIAPVLSAVCTVLLGLILLAMIVLLIIPQVTNAVNMLIEKMPRSQDQLWEICEKQLLAWNTPEFIMKKLREFDVDWDTAYNYVTNFLDGKVEITSVLGTAFSATASVLSTVTNLVLGLIIAIYLLVQKERVLYVFHKFLQLVSPKRYQEQVFRILHLANTSFANFLTGQIIEAVIIGSLCTLGLYIFRFPYAATIGILTGITALLPIIGAWIGGGVGALLILVEAPERVIWFLVFILALQQIEGQFIYPRVVGNSIGLPGLLVLVAVILGGGFAGIMGIIFAVPLFAILYQLLKEAIHNMEEAERLAVPEPEPETGLRIVDRPLNGPTMEAIQHPAIEPEPLQEPEVPEQEPDPPVETKPLQEPESAAAHNAAQERKPISQQQKSYPQKKHNSKKKKR
ncbi:MAG: AI-2E family transporter [Oscillospiraceae bacterium]|nr:AI-2E family transporter [Oscillospiraceae bacterium]